jgi:hypothetical protein
MRLSRSALFSAAALASLAFAAPALAHPDAPPPPPGAHSMPHPGSHPDMRPEWRGHDGYQDQRGAWLTECRRRFSRHDSGVGGAIIGGVAGGVLGNVIAGHGNRTVGTIVGAGVGAVAGAVIDRAEDRGRENRDYCESYLDYYSHAGQGYGGYGHQMMATPMMMVPVMVVQGQGQRECTETVTTTEWVTVRRPHHRYVPPPRRVVPDKRVRVAPTKRVPM